ncbi:MAG: efflux RND transporter periplasmic adaptor subunit [Betaproteobacteria bacterium]
MKIPTSRHLPLWVALLVLAACGKSSPPPAPPPPPEVGVVTVSPQSAPLTKDLVGRLAPFRSADVRARVPGVLLKRTYDEGTNVKQGQPLFQIDPSQLRATLAATQATLAQTQATANNDKANAQRSRDLATSGFISKAGLDNALSTERSSAAQVQQARANVEAARLNLAFASVTAPIDGRAGQQQVTEGALVGQGEATLLTTIEQIDPIYVNFTISVADLNAMRASQKEGSITLSVPNKATVEVMLPDSDTHAGTGKLDFADAQVNPATGAVNLRAQIANPRHTLLPGMFVKVKANLGTHNGVFVIPQPAVLGDTAGAYVMVVGADGKVARRNVAISDMRNGSFVVTEGLQAGEQVIASGVQKVREGAAAKAVPWTPPAAAGTPQPPAAAGTQAPVAGAAPPQPSVAPKSSTAGMQPATPAAQPSSAK